MRLTLTPSETADPRNARYFAHACDLAYFDEAEARPKFAEELGLDAHLVSADNTQVYVGGDQENLVLAFRGSQAPNTLDGFKDWLLTNANDFLVVPEGQIGTDFAAAGVGARFHRGFMQAIAEIWEPLLKSVEAEQAKSERRIWITGHSLGGALALLAAWRLRRSFIDVYQVYTFGAPMVGNETTAQAFEREFANKIFRYVDFMDVVPLLPTISLVANLYGHCQHEHRLGDEPAEQPATIGAKSLFQSFAGKVTDSVLQLTMIDELWGHVEQRIASHMMANYQSKIAEICKD